MSEDRIEVREGSSWQLPAIIVLGLVALGGLAFGWNASSKLDSTQQAVATQLKAVETQSEHIATETARLQKFVQSLLLESPVASKVAGE